LLPPLCEALPRLRPSGARAKPGPGSAPRSPRALRSGARMIAMVLAAGLGTRLRPLTEKIPKPALPLLGSTLLEENLALVARLGVREVVVNAHHLADQVARIARSAADRLGLKLHLSIESPEPLGTGGALVAARPLLDR